MRFQLAILTAVLFGLAITGCDSQPIDAAVNGATPAVGIPVGPIPGPGKESAANLPHNPYSGNAVALAEGRHLFIWYNCAGCHGGHGGGGMGPSLRNPRWMFGGDDAHIFASIAEGRGHGMPAWGTMIPQDQIWKLVAYIKSMRTTAEPDPPLLPPEPKVKEAK